MIELIIIIFIGVKIYKTVQKRRQEEMENQRRPNASMPQQAGPWPTGRPDTQQKQRPMAGHGAQQAARQTTVQSAIQEAKEDGNTTTAYLMEKAAADEKEHAREKYVEQKRLDAEKGRLTAAERFLDGDPVPPNKQCVSCGYCGAQNLIPAAPRMKYSCYFCREPL